MKSRVVLPCRAAAASSREMAQEGNRDKILRAGPSAVGVAGGNHAAFVIVRESERWIKDEVAVCEFLIHLLLDVLH